MLALILVAVLFNIYIGFAFLNHVTNLHIDGYSKLYAEVNETKEILKSYIDFKFDEMLEMSNEQWFEIEGDFFND